MEELNASLNHYRVLFGVDDKFLEFKAKYTQMLVESWKKIKNINKKQKNSLKSLYLLSTQKEESLRKTLLKHLKKFASAYFRFLAMRYYSRKIYYLQLFPLDTVSDDVKCPYRDIFKQVVQSQFTNSYWLLPHQMVNTSESWYNFL